MARPPADYRAVHSAADSIEPRLTRAFVRAVERMRERVDINDLAMALARKDVRAAMALLTAEAARDALTPVGTIARDAVLRGGRVGAERLTAARGAR